MKGKYPTGFDRETKYNTMIANKSSCAELISCAKEITTIKQIMSLLMNYNKPQSIIEFKLVEKVEVPHIRDLFMDCQECDFIFHHHMESNTVPLVHCPQCGIIVPHPYINPSERRELFDLVEALPIYAEEDVPTNESKMHDALERALFHCEWYDSGSYIVQACWIALFESEFENERIDSAIRYFENAYHNASRRS